MIELLWSAVISESTSSEKELSTSSAEESEPDCSDANNNVKDSSTQQTEDAGTSAVVASHNDRGIQTVTESVGIDNVELELTSDEPVKDRSHENRTCFCCNKKLCCIL